LLPAVEGNSSLVPEYKTALAKYFGEAPDYVSLEGYVVGRLMIEAMNRAGPQPDTEMIVEALENMRDFEMGLGTTVSFGKGEHQGSHKVWDTQITEAGKYEAIDLK
jgi:branched-chain amino acid transport system substrate-binding protein